MSTWNSDWNDLQNDKKAQLKARQGVGMVHTSGLKVVDLDSGEQVAQDGIHTGEILIRGNTIMKGYLKDLSTTETVFKNGWFHTGDIFTSEEDFLEKVTRLKEAENNRLKQACEDDRYRAKNNETGQYTYKPDNGPRPCGDTVWICKGVIHTSQSSYQTSDCVQNNNSGGGGSGITSLAADSSPQLGGDLDVAGNAIVSASNGNIAITPNGSGKICL